MRRCLILVLLFQVAAVMSQPSETVERIRRIVLFYPQTGYGSSSAIMDTALRRHIVAHSTERVKFDRVELHPKWYEDSELQEAWHNLMKVRYAGEPLDLLIVLEGKILSGLANTVVPSVFDDLPILLGNPSWSDDVPARFADNLFHLNVEVDLRGTLDLACRLQPDLECVFVLYGTSPFDVSLGELQVSHLKDHAGDMRIEGLTGLTLAELAGSLSSLPDKSALFFSSMLADGAGQRVSQFVFFQRLGEVVNAPVYAGWKTSLGLGAVGGKMLAMDDYGRVVADAALQILAGKHIPGETISAPAISHNYVDWRVAKKWKLPLSNLPADTEIINRPHTIWNQHRRTVVAALALIFGLGLFAAVIGRQNLRIRRTKGLLQREQEELRSLQGQLRLLAKVAVEKDEEEHSHIARELHDDISQRVAALALDLADFEQRLRKSGNRFMSNEIKLLRDRHVDLAHSLHGLSRRLHPTFVEELGLKAALKSTIEGMERDHGMQIDCYCDLENDDFPAAVALTVYRVAHQALTNVSKHARTKKATVFLRYVPEGLELVVEDEGVGFDPAVSGGGGIGLISMRERVLSHGGKWDIFSAPDAGTSIRVLIPV